MATRPLCIVCGKSIPKQTGTIYFDEATAERPHGDRRYAFSGSLIFNLSVNRLPTNKAEAQSLINEKIVSVSYHQGHVHSVGTWDGESYVDPHFHSDRCAVLQGRASAQSGQRFVWRD